MFICVEEQERNLSSRKKLVRKQENCEKDGMGFILRNYKCVLSLFVLKQVAVHLSLLGLLRPWRWYQIYLSVGAWEELFMASPARV